MSPDTGAVTTSPRTPDRVEWPTLLVAAGCWGGWIGTLALHERLPWPVLLVALALLNGWYMSFQHEVIHGHPTPWRWLNTALAWAPIHLWLPYDVYRRTHLLHHQIELTRPGIDPESFYVTPQQWQAASPARRLLLRVNRTYLGRVTVWALIGPISMVLQGPRDALRSRREARVWVVHVVAAGAVGWVVFGVFDVPVWQYLVGFCWLGMSVTYTRSFVEHLAVPEPGTRSAVVRSNPLMGLLFLNNNLHHAHHAMPGAAWYRLPLLCDEMGADAIAAEGAGLYRGYIEVIRRYGIRPFSQPVSPLDEIGQVL